MNSILFAGRFADEHSISLSVFHRQANNPNAFGTPQEEGGNFENRPNSFDSEKSAELQKKDRKIELLGNELRYLKKINEELKKKERKENGNFDCTKSKVLKCEV